MTNSSQVNAGTVSAATTSVAHNRSNTALALAEKPAKFSGVDFKRWQQKMFFEQGLVCSGIAKEPSFYTSSD